jgi:hypothetical protein
VCVLCVKRDVSLLGLVWFGLVWFGLLKLCVCVKTVGVGLDGETYLVNTTFPCNLVF